MNYELIFICALTVLLLITIKNWKKDSLMLYFKPEPTITLYKKPKVSILIPAWNESHIISSCIESFKNLSYPDKELIVIAGGRDGTYEIAEKYAAEGVIALKQRQPGKNAALNDGFEHSTGDIIVLTDADCVLSDAALTSIIGPIVNESEAVTTGKCRPLDFQLSNKFVLYQYALYVYGHARVPKYVTWILGRNASLRRGVLEDVGGFDETAFAGTDYSLAKNVLKRGYKIRFVSNSVTETEYPDSLIDFIQQQSRWLRYIIVHDIRFRSSERVKSIIKTSIIGSMMLVLPFFAIPFGRVAIYIWFLLIIMGILNRTRYIKFASEMHKDVDFKGVMMRVPVYMFVDFLAWAFVLIDYALPWRRKRW